MRERTQSKSTLGERKRQQEREADHRVCPNEQQNQNDGKFRLTEEGQLQSESRDNETHGANQLQDHEVQVVRNVVRPRGHAVHTQHDGNSIFLLLHQGQHENREQERKTCMGEI